MNAARQMEESGMIGFEDATAPNELRPGATLSFLFICLFVVAIYARPEDVYPSIAALHLTLLLGLCAGAAFLWSLFLGEVSIIWSQELRIVLLLTAWFAAGIPFAYWRGGSFMVLTQIWLKTVLIFFLLTQTLITLKRIRTILWAIILSEFAVTTFSLLAPSQMTWKSCLGCEGAGDAERMVGVNHGFLYWNVLGIAIGMIVPYMAALFIAKRSALRSLLLVATIVSMFWMQVLTASRSGTIVVAFSVLLTSLFVARGSLRGKVIRTGTVLALLATICLAPAIFWDRLSTITDDNSAAVGTAEASADLSKNERLTLLMRSVTYTLEHPMFGLGLGNFDVANGNDLDTPEAWIGSHNTYTQISSEAGVPALLLFLGLLCAVLRNMKRVIQTTMNDPQYSELNLMARASVVSLAAFVLGALFAHKGYDYYAYTAPIAVAVGIQQIAAARQIGPQTAAQNLATQPQYFNSGWTL